jgi:hypothetical protein
MAEMFRHAALPAIRHRQAAGRCGATFRPLNPLWVTMEDPMPDLDISAEKVAFVVMKAREFDAKVAPFDDGDEETADEQPRADGALENRKDDPALKELLGFFRALNDDEKANLVAIAWIGRETFDVDDWPAALAAARAERTTPTEHYLLGMPLLADHLEAGMDALGFDMAEIESDVAAEG